MDSLTIRNSDQLTNLGYVCKLYTKATSVNNRPVACVLNKTDAGNTKIFATRRDDKVHILMGTWGKDPQITELHVNNAGNYNYNVTLWIIPNSTKNNPFDESDLIECYSETKSPVGDTLTIDVTDWSGRASAKYDACYIEVELIVKPLFVSIDGPLLSMTSLPPGRLMGPAGFLLISTPGTYALRMWDPHGRIFTFMEKATLRDLPSGLLLIKLNGRLP